MNKTDYIWLSRNTEISNSGENIDALCHEDLVLRLYRKHHLGRLQQIFGDYKTELFADENDYWQLKINGFKVADFYACARALQAEQIFNLSDGKIYYIPPDQARNRRIFNRTNSKILANLPINKKLNILFSLNQKCYFSADGRRKSEEALAKKTDRLFALLQLKFPDAFIKDEMRKVRLITADIARIPQIKNLLENFARLTRLKQRELLQKTCEITAKYNQIATPQLTLLSDKEIAQDAGVAKWADVDAYSYEKNVIINQDKLKKLSGTQALSLAWHETTHVAQETGDYSAYPHVEDMFNANLGYLQKMPEVYLFDPEEQIVYALEKQFIENLVAYTQIKTNDSTFSFAPEYDIATQYLHRALQRKL